MSDVQQGIESTPAEEPGLNQATETVPSHGDERLSVRDAANSLADYRHKRDAKERVPQAAPRGAPPTEKSPPPEQQAGDEGNLEDYTYGREEGAQPEESAIEPPRSWSNEEKERFSQLPRETQEYLTRRENERDTALRRGQNEAAQRRQTLEVQEKAVEQMRQQYEQILPALAQQLQQQQAGEFADIRTQQDVDNLARNDWQRFAMWQAHQMKVQNLNQQMQANYQRSQQEYASKWSKFTENEDRLFAEGMPEMSDPAQARDIAEKALTLLRDTGFSDDDLNQLWNGQASVSLRDNRIQRIIAKAARYDAAKAGVPAKRAALPASRTLRPGTPAERASDKQVELSALENRLGETGKWKDGAELLLARRAARR